MALADKLAEALDDEIDLDFSKARESNFGKIECKDYEAEIIEAKPGVSKKGDPKVVFQWRITEEGPAKGRVFFKHAPAAGDGSGILRDTLRAIGMEAESKLKTSTTVGKKALITIRDQKDDPEYQEIAKVKPLKGSEKAAGTSRRSRLS